MSRVSIRIKIAGIVVVALGVVLVASLILAGRASERSMQRVSFETVRNAQQTFAGLVDADVDMLGATLTALTSRDDLRESFVAGDREELYERAQPVFRKLERDYSITHWYFETTESESAIFLRVHDKDRFGDHVGRITYQQAVRSQVIGSGLELGKTAFAVRVVVPYLDAGGTLIGYMELGKEIGEFLDKMRDLTGDHYAMILEKQYLDANEWASVVAAQGIEDTWGDHPKYLMVESTLPGMDVWTDDDDIMVVPPSGRVMDVVTENGQTVVRGLFPIEDAAGRQVGVVMVARDIGAYLEQLSDNRVRSLITMAIAVLLTGVAIILLLDRLVFARLTRVMDHLGDLSADLLGGDYDEKHYVITAGRQDEIGEFEEFMGGFLARIASAMRESPRRRR